MKVLEGWRRFERLMGDCVFVGRRVTKMKKNRNEKKRRVIQAHARSEGKGIEGVRE